MVNAKSAHIYRALADPTRRAMLDHLKQGPQTVNGIAEKFTISRPAVSKHLRVLRRCRLVLEEKHGRERVHRLNATPLQEVDRWLSTYRQFWSHNLAALKAYVESTSQEP